MAPRVTTAALAATVAQQGEALTEITNVLGVIAARLDGQHATPAAVAEKVAKPAQPVLNPREIVKAGVEKKGLAFARGGALLGSVAVAEAIVRVLKANKPGGFEVVSVQGDVKSLDGRHVTHIAVGLVSPGVFFTQYVYTPEA